MVTITNGIETRLVSNGAFNNIYRSKGYHIVDGKEPRKIEKEVKEVAEEEPINDVAPIEESEVEESEAPAEESDWVTELLEKPISQWTKEEVADFVKEKEIDTSSARKVSEVKDIIKKWMDEHNR